MNTTLRSDPRHPAHRDDPWPSLAESERDELRQTAMSYYLCLLAVLLLTALVLVVTY